MLNSRNVESLRIRLAVKYNRTWLHDSCDIEYICHELAHFVLLFKRKPKGCADFDSMDRILERMTKGRSQLHELHVIAIQRAVQSTLGLSLHTYSILTRSYDGIKDVADSRSRRGKPIIRSFSQAKSKMLSIRPSVKACEVFRQTLLLAL